MVALSALLGVPVRTPNGDMIGCVRDVVVRFDDDEREAVAEDYPRVIGLAVEGDHEPSEDDHEHGFVPWDLVADAGPDGVALHHTPPEIRGHDAMPAELGLRQGLLDRLVVDVAHGRLARVNDVELGQHGDTLCLLSVEIGPRALLRRLGIGALGDRLLARLGGLARPSGSLDWAQVVPLPEGDEHRPAWMSGKSALLGRLDPNDLAKLASDLSPRQGAALLGVADAQVAAAAIEQMEDVQQAQVLRAMDPERAADVLDEMDPDEATDALQALRNLDTEEADDLLGRMERDEADDVRELSEYPNDTAGGLMTTDFVAVPADVAAGSVLEALRQRERAAVAGEGDPVPEALADVYIVEPDLRPSGRSDQPMLETEGRLLGIVGLRELVLAEPSATLGSIMRPVNDVAHPLDDARTVARAIADADVVALPIVDENGALLGIVTVDDAIDVILPGQWRIRPSRRAR